MLTRKVEYVLAGALALYIVFGTRPALSCVSSLLSSPIAQVLGLAAVVYVGTCWSLVVALMLGLALVLSSPGREHATDMKKDEGEQARKDAKKHAPTKSALKTASEKVSASSKPAESVEPVAVKESFTVGSIQAADF